MHLMSYSFPLSAIERICSNPLCICRTSAKWSTFTTFRAASLSPCCASASRPSAVRRTVKWSSKTSGCHFSLVVWHYRVLSGRTERWCFCVCLCRERCGVITLRPAQNGQTSRHRWDSLGPSGGSGGRRFGRKGYIDLGKWTQSFLSL